MNHVLAGAPAYCLHRTLASKPLSPAEWGTCFKYGFKYGLHLPSTAVAHAGYDLGIVLVPVVLIIIGLLVYGMVRRAENRAR